MDKNKFCRPVSMHFGQSSVFTVERIFPFTVGTTTIFARGVGLMCYLCKVGAGRQTEKDEDRQRKTETNRERQWGKRKTEKN